jgi:hypothetical protein
LGTEKRTAVKDMILALGKSLITDLDRLSVQIRDVMRRVGMIRFVGSLGRIQSRVDWQPFSLSC